MRNKGEPNDTRDLEKVELIITTTILEKLFSN